MDSRIVKTIKYLTLLELSTDETINVELVKSNYRKLCKFYHPDQANERYKDGAKFREITEAKNYLIENTEEVNQLIKSNFSSASQTASENNYARRQEETRQRAAEEAKRKAQEEAERKSREEAQRKAAEEERQRKEAEDRKRRWEEDKRRAEEERKQREENEIYRKAAEEKAAQLAKEKKKHKAKKIKIAIVILVVCVLALPYAMAQIFADLQEFSLAKYLIDFPTVKLDSKLVNYIYTGNNYDEGEYLKAARSFSHFDDYKDSKKLAESAISQYYDKANSLFILGNYKKAAKAFGELEDYGYKDAHHYKILSYAWASPQSLTDDEYQELFADLRFENTKEAILHNKNILAKFLEGEWKTINGKYTLIMTENHDFLENNTLPHSSVQKEITYDDGLLYEGTYKDRIDGNSTDLFEFHLISSDVIRVYCYSDGTLYALKRQ